ncbi:MAG: helix-turn-helix domain-containing protein [Pseudonocardiaceae bacterium]
MSACPNEAFRHARRTRALTQGQLAARVAELVEQATERGCGIDADYISKIERGTIRWPSTAYRAAFRTLLGATSDADLGLYCPRSTDATLIVAPSLVAPAIVGGKPTWAEDAVIDRDLISYANAATIGALSAHLPNLLRGALHRTAVPARINEHHVEQLKRVVEFFQRSDLLFGGGMSRNAAAGQLEWACDVLDKSAMSDTVRRSWQSTTARLADVAGYMSFDCGDDIAARRFFLVALQLAAEAGDVQQRVHTLTSAARQAIHLDRNDLGRDLMRLAHAEDRRLSPVARAVLTIVESRAFGREADIAGVERTVGQADDLFGQRAADPDDPTWVWYYDNAQMTGDGGSALLHAAMRSGDARIAGMARQRLQAAHDLYPADAARPHSHCLLKVACLTLRFDDPHRGLTLAEQALDTAASLRSTRIAEDVRMLAKTAAPLERDAGFRPRVRELRRTAQRVAQAVA